MKREAAGAQIRPGGISLSTVLICSGLAAFFLVISNSAIWFNRYIFKTNNFTQLTAGSLLSESSRQAMATEITDRLLEKRPVLKSAIDDKAAKLIAALLGTSAAETIVKKSVTILQASVTSINPQPVEIDLSGIKSIVTNILSIVRQKTDRPEEEHLIKTEDIPDKIVLLDPTKLPNIYRLGVTLMWLGLLTFLAAVCLLGFVIYRTLKHAKERIWRILAIEGGFILLGAIFALLLGPLFKPPILAQVPSPNTRVVIENLYDAFLAPFNRQAWLLFVIGVVFCLVSTWPYVRRAFNAMRRSPKKA